MAADNYHDSRHLLFPQPDGQHKYQYASRALFLPCNERPGGNGARSDSEEDTRWTGGSKRAGAYRRM